MITDGVGAVIRKERVFPVTMLRSPPEPAEGQKKPQEDSKLEPFKSTTLQH